MKIGKASASGALISLTFFAMFAGNAAAERVPCDHKEHLARGYSIDKLWEEAVSCARDRRSTVALLRLGQAYEAGTDYVPRDWRRAAEAYELVIEFNKDRAVPTYGSVLRAEAVKLLVRNFSRRNGAAVVWPQDLERARYYIEQELSMLQLPAEPEYSKNRADFIQLKQKDLAEIDQRIAGSVGYLVGDLSIEADLRKIAPVRIDNHIIGVADIYNDPEKEENTLLYHLYFLGKAGRTATDVCVKVSAVDPTENVSVKDGIMFRIDFDAAQYVDENGDPWNQFAGRARGYALPLVKVRWPEGLSRNRLRIELENTGDRKLCEQDS